MGGSGFPPCWFVWPEATQQWSLPRLFGGANGGLREGSCQGVLPELLLPVSLSPQWDTDTPCLCRRPPNTSRQVWFCLLWGHCSFPWSRYSHHPVFVLQEQSLCFPLSGQGPAIKSHQPSKSDSLGIPPPIARPPSWEAWHWAQHLHSSG